jgi:ATP phosphoribosyltransferase
VLVSYTEMVVNKASYDNPAKLHAMGQLMTLLLGTLDARDKVLVKLNVDADHFKAVLAVLPSAKSADHQRARQWGIRDRIGRRQANDQHIDPRAEDAGASDILELPISKIVA